MVAEISALHYRLLEERARVEQLEQQVLLVVVATLAYLLAPLLHPRSHLLATSGPALRPAPLLALARSLPTVESISLVARSFCSVARFNVI